MTAGATVAFVATLAVVGGLMVAGGVLLVRRRRRPLGMAVAVTLITFGGLAVGQAIAVGVGLTPVPRPATVDDR